MKTLIKALIRRSGFELIPSDLRAVEINKLIDTLIELEGFYREFVLKDLPAFDKERILLLTRLLGTGYTQGLYIINYLHQCLGIEGDICEFGVAQGRTSALLASEIRNTNKNIWLFDSFAGLPKPTQKDVLK